MNIHQLQLTYSTQEDRLILRINSKENEEIRLFLTRRMLVSFWDILTQAVNHSISQKTFDDIKNPAINSTPEVQKMKQQVQHQDIVDKSDYKTPFNEGNKFPIGESPALIEKITINTLENTTTTLIFYSNNGQNINLNLNQQLLHNLSDLIIKVIPSTDWNITLAGGINMLITEGKGNLALH